MERLADYIAARRAAMPRTLVRAALALMRGRGSVSDARTFANHKRGVGDWWDTPDVGDLLRGFTDRRAAEQYVTKADVTGMDESVVTAGRDFIAWRYPTLIVGQLTEQAEARRTSFATAGIVQSAGTIAQWAGEAQPKIVVEAQLASVSLFPRKVAALTSLSLEQIEAADVNTEELLGKDLGAAVHKVIDETFASADAEVPGVSPAGIFANVPTVPSSGTSAANMRTDLKSLFSTFTGNGNSMDGAVLITSKNAVVALNSEGIATANTLTVAGGNLFGVPVIVSSSMAANSIGLLASQDVVFALGDVVTLDASRNATIDMVGASNPTFDFFSRNVIGLRAELFASWSLAGGPRDSSGSPLAAALLINASYA